MMRKFLAPLRMMKPFESVAERYCPIFHGADGEPLVHRMERQLVTLEDAIAACDAIGSIIDIWNAQIALEDAIVPPPEEVIRGILIVMLMSLRSKPIEGSDVYVDTLVFELSEPESGEPICATAIAAAARETWQSQTFAPSIHEFLGRARKYQSRLEMELKQLGLLAVIYCQAAEMIEPPPGDDVEIEF
jgi:hypothetical protein